LPSIPAIGPQHDYFEYYNEIISGCEFMKDSATLYARSVFTQCGLFFRYFASWLVPLPTSVDMRVEFVSRETNIIFFITYCFSSLALLLSGRTRFLGAGLLLAACLFAPELSVPRTGEMFVMYRSYLYAVGYMIALGWVFERTKTWVVGCLIGLMVFTTMARLDQFQTPVKLWTHAANMIDMNNAETACQSSRAFNNSGSALIQEGRFVESIGYLKKAVAINGMWFAPKVNLATGYYFSGQFDKARPLFEEVLRDPAAERVWPRAREALKVMRRE